MPELFDDNELFETEDQKGGDRDKNKKILEKQNIKFVKKLHKILKPFILKRTKK